MRFWHKRLASVVVGHNRGDSVFDPAGRKIGTNLPAIRISHESPFTASSFETTNQTTAIERREYEPFGSEIPTTPPPNSTPDWIYLGNFQQTGNPHDLQGGCMEDGFPVDCSEMVKRVCVGNPRCMNKDNKVGGLGYYLAGVSARGDFKGRFGFKVLDGKLVPTVFVAGWADQRVWDYIGMAGLANYQGPPVYSWSFVGYNVNANQSGELESRRDTFVIDPKSFKNAVVNFFKIYGKKFRRCVWEIFSKDKDGNSSDFADIMETPSSQTFPYGSVTIYDSISGAQAFLDNKTGKIGFRKTTHPMRLMNGTWGSAADIFYRNLAHEYGNYLSWFYTGNGSTFGTKDGIPGDADVGGGLGLASAHRDTDTGARMEKCIWGNVAY